MQCLRLTRSSNEIIISRQKNRTIHLPIVFGHSEAFARLRIPHANRIIEASGYQTIRRLIAPFDPCNPLTVTDQHTRFVHPDHRSFVCVAFEQMNFTIGRIANGQMALGFVLPRNVADIFTGQFLLIPFLEHTEAEK